MPCVDRIYSSVINSYGTSLVEIFGYYEGQLKIATFTIITHHASPITHYLHDPSPVDNTFLSQIRQKYIWKTFEASCKDKFETFAYTYIRFYWLKNTSLKNKNTLSQFPGGDWLTHLEKCKISKKSSRWHLGVVFQSGNLQGNRSEMRWKFSKVNWSIASLTQKYRSNWVTLISKMPYFYFLSHQKIFDTNIRTIRWIIQLKTKLTKGFFSMQYCYNNSNLRSK